MKMNKRSFPHPVVGNADDVAAEYQVTFDFSSDRTNFYLNARARCSSKTLGRLIRKGVACNTLHVDCSNTLYRRFYDFDGEEYQAVIPATELNGDVEVNAFVRAKKAIPDYTVADAHEDYRGVTFDVRPGDILALAKGQVFPAENSVDPLRRVGSLMVIEQSQEAGNCPMKADYNHDKIRILLSKTDFEAYREVKAVPALTSHLTTTLVLPVLMSAIQRVEADKEGEDLRWVVLLKRKLEVDDIRVARDTLTKAQLLLEYPIRRALHSAKELKANLAGPNP